MAENFDRFIPNRSAIDWDYARLVLTEPSRGGGGGRGNEIYRNRLADVLGINNGRTRILAFRDKPLTPGLRFVVDEEQTVKGFRRLTVSQRPDRILDASGLVNDHCLNLLDWGTTNVLAVALRNTVYLLDSASCEEFLTVDEDAGPVTSVRWHPDGRHIAVGFQNSEIDVWDVVARKCLTTLIGSNESRVGSLDWNQHFYLTSGGGNGMISNYDVRIAPHVVESYYAGHKEEICGLKWSSSGRQLASGGNDKLLHIWDRLMSSSNSRTKWLHRFKDHPEPVMGLAWCPFQRDLLASGSGGAGVTDGCIKFWNTHTGTCLNTVYTTSEVCSLLWNENENGRELLSSHGFSENQLTLWKYPSMVKLTELKGHTSRVLFTAQSPDGCTVASAAGDETVCLWKVFKPARTINREPFADFNRIGISTYWSFSG